MRYRPPRIVPTETGASRLPDFRAAPSRVGISLSWDKMSRLYGNSETEIENRGGWNERAPGGIPSRTF